MFLQRMAEDHHGAEETYVERQGYEEFPAHVVKEYSVHACRLASGGFFEMPVVVFAPVIREETGGDVRIS